MRNRPGNVLKAGLEEVRRYLVARQGNSGGEKGELEPAMEAYFTSILWHSANGHMGRRSRDETCAPANIIESILEDNHDGGGA